MTTLRPLRRRAFATVWSSSVVSDIGTWMQLIVLGVLVGKASNSVLAVGLVMSAQFIPSLIGAPLGGLMADKYDRRKILLWALAAQTLITALLATVVGFGERRAWVLAIIVLIQGASVSFGGAAAGAMMPQLVPKEELLAAVSLGSASWNTGRIIGPAAAFVMTHFFGATGAIGANAVSFAVMWVAIWSLRHPFKPLGTVTGNWLAEIFGGARTLWATPGCRVALQGLIPMQLFLAPFMGLLPVIAKRLGGEQGLTSAMSTAQGIGAVIGAGLVPMAVARFGRDRTLMVHWVASALFTMSFGWITDRNLAVFVTGLFGGAFVGVLVSFMAIMNRDAPETSRGRVMSIFFACMGPMYGIGVALNSLVADVIGEMNLHRVAGLCALATLVFSLVGRRWNGWEVLTPASRRVPVVSAAAA